MATKLLKEAKRSGLPLPADLVSLYRNPPSENEEARRASWMRFRTKAKPGLGFYDDRPNDGLKYGKHNGLTA